MAWIRWQVEQQEDDGDAGSPPHTPQEAPRAPAPAQDTPEAPEAAQTGAGEAGASLDEAVALEIMGWRSYRYADSVPRGGELMRWLDDPQRMSLRGPGIVEADPALPLYADGMGRVPAYSTDWSAMRLVVEEMGRRGLDCDLSAPAGGARYYARIFDSIEAPRKFVCTGTGATLPEAMARAALAAARIEKDNQP